MTNVVLKVVRVKSLATAYLETLEQARQNCRQQLIELASRRKEELCSYVNSIGGFRLLFQYKTP